MALASTFTMFLKTSEAVTGFFIHDAPNVTVFRPVSVFLPCPINPLSEIPPSFGLLDPSDDRWDTLSKRIAKLNHHAHSKISFKLFQVDTAKVFPKLSILPPRGMRELYRSSCGTLDEAFPKRDDELASLVALLLTCQDPKLVAMSNYGPANLVL
ncbi:hypothetical protein ONZ45_g3504 [Pleurotus djamor]|nr:hypothetical protein ONZ45_g3504 [Pleurotus djamor]